MTISLEAPATRALAALPTPPSSLVGRAREVQQARQLLAEGGVRLLTLTGPGGVGKTRLAVAIAEGLAEHVAERVHFVDLSAIHEPAQVLTAIADALSAREVARRSVADAIRLAVSESSVLLVLDNCEQVLAAAPAIGDLLATCPGLTVLATSREPLNLRWEQVLPVPPLALPDSSATHSAGEVATAPAVVLFVQRARAVHPGFVLTEANAAAVVEICARLDGLPLAIELAAARSRMLPPAALLARLTHQLDLLQARERDRPARHQTLRAALAWSYDLLTSEERAVLRRLAVFAGGCSLDGAAAVCGSAEDAPDLLGVLGGLVDRSLVADAWGAGEHGGRVRLLETVRVYALEQLQESGEEEETRRRHADFFMALVEQAEQGLYGPEQRQWIEQLAVEHDNIRAALQWTIARNETALALRLVGVLWAFWVFRGQLSEGFPWLEAALALEGSPEDAARAKALHGAGYLAGILGNAPRAAALQEESLAILRAIGDWSGVAKALCSLGIAAWVQGDHTRAVALTEEALPLADEAHDRWTESYVSRCLGLMLRDAGDPERARALAERSTTIARELNDRISYAYGRMLLGLLALDCEAHDEAESLSAETLAAFQEGGDHWGILLSVLTLAHAALRRGQVTRATRLFAAAEVLCAAAGMPMPVSERERAERALATTRATLGETAFVAAQAEVSSLPPQQALEHALRAGAPDLAAIPGAEMVGAHGQRASIRGAPPTDDRQLTRLSRREREVAALIAQGLSSKEIAAALVVSERTVDAHADHIRRKLGLHSRAQIAAWATQHGLRADAGETSGPR